MTSSAEGKLVSTVFEEYGAITRRALKEYLPGGDPQRYLYDLIDEYPRRGGKMMRPSLCLATARAFGARLEDAVRSAAVIELLHNAMLIHDDIEDASEERRGRPTLHVQHGVPLALNAGDAMTMLCLRPLIDNSRTLGLGLAWRVMQETDRMARESAEGQAIELGWIHDNATRLEDADYLEMVLKKTCWLATIYPLRVGALIGTRDGVELDPFIRFGFFLGTAFQIQDDLLNLVGESAGYGKERDGDIWEGKRTLMLIRLFSEAAPGERARLSEILSLGREERTAAQVAWVRRLMDAYGCIDYGRQVARGLGGAALHEHALLFAGLPDSRDKFFLEALATWVLKRET